MSKLGKKPITIPKDTKVKLESGKLFLTGPKGSKELSINDKIFTTSISKENNLILKLLKKNESSSMLWGTTRSLLNSIILGSINDFTKTLKLVGTGYKAILQGKILKISAGYSHDIDYQLPEGINIKCQDPNTVEISGANKTQVGQVAADIRSFRKPEPYKGKGIKYENEYIFRKEGKKK